MPVTKTAPFVFSGEIYHILDVVNSYGNSGRGTLAKWFHVLFCREPAFRHVLVNSQATCILPSAYCSSLWDLLLKVNVTWRMPSNCSFSVSAKLLKVQIC